MDSTASDLAVEKLKEEWGKYLSVSPTLALDGTWPSIGVIDQLTFCLRLKEEINPALEPMLRGAAAYIAKVAKNTWQSFAEEVEIYDTQDGFSLRARGGEFLPDGEEVRYPVERELRRLLREFPDPFPMFLHFDVPVRFESPIVSFFALGVFTALGPAIEGYWEHFSPDDPKPWTKAVVRHLAADCAKSYSRMFPDEPVGQVSEIYLSGLVYPPPMVTGALPFTVSMEQLTAIFTEYGFAPEQVRRFAQNLCKSPDETLSSVGLILCCAISEELPPPEILAVAESKRSYSGILRAAMLRIRLGFCGKSDWVESGLLNEQDKSRFLVETEMGFVPWLELDATRLQDSESYQKLRPIIQAACSYDLAMAERQLQKLLDVDPGDVDLRILQVKFVMIRGEFTEAAKLLSNLSTEPGSEQFPRMFKLWGLCALETRDLDLALKNFRKGLSVAEHSPFLKAELLNNIAWTLMLQGGKDEKALARLEESLKLSPSPLTMLLNKLSLVWEIGMLEEVRQTRERLFALAPCDRRVFASLALNEDTMKELLN